MIHFLKFAMGSTNLHTDWHPDGAYFRAMLRFVRAALAALRRTAPTRVAALRGIFWLQGETDAGGNAAAVNGYEDNLVVLVQRLRAALATAEDDHPRCGAARAVPFVASQLVWNARRACGDGVSHKDFPP